MLPNVQVDGTLNVQGDVFIPSGATLSCVVEKVTSTDNAVVRFDGVTGEVQNSGVIIDDNNRLLVGTPPVGLNTLGQLIVSPPTSETVNLVLTNKANDSYTYFYNDGNATVLASSYNTTAGYKPIVFQTGGAERMRITPSGNLLVGTTTDNGVDKLQVNGGIKATRYISDNKTLSNAGIAILYDAQSKYIQIKTNCSAGGAAHIILSGFCYTPNHLMHIDCAGYADINFIITNNIIKDINGNGVTGSWYKSSDNKLCLELVATTDTGFSGSLLNIDLQRTLYSPSLLEILSYNISGTKSRY